jgi:hypothetical protein
MTTALFPESECPFVRKDCRKAYFEGRRALQASFLDNPNNPYPSKPDPARYRAWQRGFDDESKAQAAKAKTCGTCDGEGVQPIRDYPGVDTKCGECEGHGVLFPEASNA